MPGRPTGIEISKDHFENALKVSGISKNKLAKEMGINIRLLQKNINEYQRMSYNNLMNACRIMDIHPSYLTDPDYDLANTIYDIEWYKENNPEVLSRLDPNNIYIQHFLTHELRKAYTDETEYLKNYIRSRIQFKKKFNSLVPEAQEYCIRYIFSNANADQAFEKIVDKYFADFFESHTFTEVDEKGE